METLTETVDPATAVRAEAGISALACHLGQGGAKNSGARLVDVAWLHNLRILNSHPRNQLPTLAHASCVYIHLSIKGHFLK